MENEVLEKEKATNEITIETAENKILKNKKRKNIELYKKYKVFSYDLLFYYAIIYLFLTIEKGISAAEVLQFDAFYVLFKSILQIPSTILIEKIGKRKSLIIANFVNVVHILIIILAPNFKWLLVSQFLCAFGFIIKATCETDMLYDSIEHGEKRGSIFAKIDGKANARHYYIEAISSVISGFLFVINPYIPMILCLLILIFSAVMSVKFEDIQGKLKKTRISDNLRELRYSFRNIIKSKRLVSLLLFNALMIGMIKILQNLRNTVLLEVEMPEQYFGIIFAIMGIIAGISARNQERIHKKFRNKTLTFLALPMAFSCLFMGVVLMLNMKFEINVSIILVLFAIQYIMKGPYYVLIKRYLNNFTNSEKRVKIATVNNLIENLIASILIFGASSILDILPINITLLIIGCVGIMLFVLLLDKMRSTVGLKMEDYGKREIL